MEENGVVQEVVKEKKEEKKRINQLAYCFMALFLGDFGVHKFYEGRAKLGILYLVFCWTFIPAIVGAIEGLVALTKNCDEHGNMVR